MRKISEIAADIRANWKNVNYAAKPYLDAMSTLDSVEDKYIHDSGKSVVLYFLSNAGSFRGEAAKQLKAELREMVK